MNKSHKMLLDITSRHLISSPLKDKENIIIEEIVNLNEELKKDAPVFKQTVNNAFFVNGTIGAAIYLTFKDRMETGAIDKVNDIFMEFFRKIVEESKITQSFYSIIHKIPFVGRIICCLMTRLKETEGWIAKRGEPGALISLDLTNCGIISYLEKLGIPELCQVYCNGDDINAGFMTGLEFRREETIAKGNDACKFRYYKRNMRPTTR